MKRVFLIVLDSFGIGALPDAAGFGDSGANTLLSISRSPCFSVENLERAGLFHIDGVSLVRAYSEHTGAVARLLELSAAKDTSVGHWELSGVISHSPMPTYPDGFPEEIIRPLSLATGRGVLCNKPYSGTDVIRDFGAEHLKSGDLIVYTSADSVFQIAAHEEVVSTTKLYNYCEIARKLLTGKHGVGRVIARPFTGKDGNFRRTANRRDFSLAPPAPTALDLISGSGLSVISVGKIYDIFAGRGITESIPTHSNAEGMAAAARLLGRDFSGLAFINLVEFDSHFGHRQDADGYARALAEFDAWLPSFTAGLSDDDVLIITADHGCDPSDDSTDHTREYVPLIILGKKIKPQNLGTIRGFTSVARLICDLFSLDSSFPETVGISDKILKK